MKNLRQVTGAAGAAVLLTLPVGCHAGTAERLPSQEGSGTAQPDVSRDVADPALTAYRGMWSAFAEAAAVPDPDAPALRQYASDAALKLIVGSLVDDQTKGKVAKGRPTISPRVTSVQRTGVQITDCVDDTHWLEFNKATGQLWDNVPGGRHYTTATVNASEGTWKVTSFTLEKAGSC